MKVTLVLRRVLGVLAVLLMIWCGLALLNCWFLLPKWPGTSYLQDLRSRAFITLGLFAAGTGLAFFARWCFHHVRNPITNSTD